MTTTGQWIEGARPRTLPAAIAPVAVGTGLVAYTDSLIVIRCVLALVIAVGLQVGVNYANDYSDGIRGTDKTRVGPVRLVGQELASPRSVKMAAFVSFGIAATAGLIVIAMSGHWWLIAVGIACIAAAWLYTGGPHPYGYAGLGELFVFVFFGLVPVLGTVYVQADGITATDVVASIGVGLLACSIMLTNNLRDIPGDTAVGKRTLAVRLGDKRTRVLYIVIIIGGFAVVGLLAILIAPIVLIALLTALLAVRPIRAVAQGALGRDLIPVLKQTGLLLLAYGIVLGACIALA